MVVTFSVLGSGFNDTGFLLVIFALQFIVMIVVAVPFGLFLFYLPARSVGLAWNLGDAYRQADGARGRLIALALLCTILSLVGAVTVVAFGVLKVPDGPWFAGIGRAIVVVIDMLALYVLAHSTSQLLIARTGWKPEPLPA